MRRRARVTFESQSSARPFAGTFACRITTSVSRGILPPQPPSGGDVRNFACRDHPNAPQPPGGRLPGRWLPNSREQSREDDPALIAPVKGIALSCRSVADDGEPLRKVGFAYSQSGGRGFEPRAVHQESTTCGTRSVRRLAAAAVPLVRVTRARAPRGRFAAHRPSPATPYPSGPRFRCPAWPCTGWLYRCASKSGRVTGVPAHVQHQVR